MTEFEEIISNDRHLSKLLNDKEITVFSNFSRNAYSDDLKKYIQQKYYDIFVELYHQAMNDNEKGIANSLIRSAEFLATEETKKLISKEFEDILKLAHENILAFKASLAEGSTEVYFGPTLDTPLDGLIINIFNVFSSCSNVNDFKQKIVGVALEICDMVSGIKPSKSPFKYATYNAILNNLKTINDLGSFKERFETHQGKISKKQSKIEVKYVILTAVVIILILLRILSRLG